MAEPTSSSLVSDSARWMLGEFVALRKRTRSSEKAADAKRFLVDFLNAHLPKNVCSTFGFAIDANGRLSDHFDVVVCDATTGKTYRTSSVSQIVGSDAVAAVFDVSPSLDAASLARAYEKIASCKRLEKRVAFETFGVVFAFGSEDSLQALGETAARLNERFDPSLRPDLVVVLGKGLIRYQKRAADAIHVESGDVTQTLHRLFVMLLSNLATFSDRIVLPEPVSEAPEESSALPASCEEMPRDEVATIRLYGLGDKDAGLVWFVPWKTGALIASIGCDLAELLPTLRRGKAPKTSKSPNGAIHWYPTQTIGREQFEAWPLALARIGLRGELEIVERRVWRLHFAIYAALTAANAVLAEPRQLELNIAADREGVTTIANAQAPARVREPRAKRRAS